MAGKVWRREIPMADWIRANLPPGVAIANASTSVEYLTGHRSVNLHGVMSPGFVGNRPVEREAGVFASLGRMPAAERPGYLLLVRSAYRDSELMRALTDGPPLYETLSFGDDLVLFRARWAIVDVGREPALPEARQAVAPLEEVDRLDVGDPRDEAAHGYRCESRAGEIPLAGSVAIGPLPPPPPAPPEVLADGGRLILGHESFRVRTRSGRDLVVVLRSRSSVVAQAWRRPGDSFAVPVQVPVAGLVVRAGGREALRQSLPNRSGWNEHVLRVPAAAVAEGTTALEVAGRYASFRYWFYQ
jgi:hypothetical protein